MILQRPAHKTVGSARPLTRKTQTDLICARVLNVVLTTALEMTTSESRFNLAIQARLHRAKLLTNGPYKSGRLRCVSSLRR